MAGERAKTVRRKVTHLLADPDHSPIELAEALTQLKRYDREHFSTLVGPDAENRRKFYHLVDIWGRFGKKLPRRELAKIGWTKLTKIAELTEPDSKEEEAALGLARDGRKVIELEQNLRVAGAGNKTEHAVLLRFTSDQYAEFRAALEKHDAKKSGRGLVGKEEALMKIIRKAERA